MLNFIYSADLTFQGIRKMDFNTTETTNYGTNFPDASSDLQNGAFSYIVIRIMRLTYTWA